MAYRFNKAVINIDELTHDLIGMGDCEYRFSIEPLCLSICFNGVEVKKFEGYEAKDIYIKMTKQKDFINDKIKITISELKSMAANCCKTEVQLMEEECRFQEVVWARWLCYEFLYENGFSFSACGNIFRNKQDHATVMNAVKKVKLKFPENTKWRVESRYEFQKKITEIHNELKDEKTY